MTIKEVKEVKEISKLLPIFVQMVENDLEEDEHKIPADKLLTYEQFEQIQKLASKINNCINYVDGNIFK